jgi:ABC-2 type transport system permease protein
MSGLFAIYRKELSDYFSSHRFVILFALIAMVSFITSYMAGISLRESVEQNPKTGQYLFLMLFSTAGARFSMIQFVAFFGPLMGLFLGFDAINRERAQGTLVKVVSQPIYRDAVINGKFLAGATVITVMIISIVLIIAGFGMALLGVVPGVEEILRLAFYVLISMFYICFWLAVSILFSILFKSTATSALASVAAWILLSFVVFFGASAVANAVAPVDQKESADLEEVMKNVQITEAISVFSPMVLYMNSTATIVDPSVNTTKSFVLRGPWEQILSARFQNPLSLGQSLSVVVPYIVALIAITLIFFAVSYTVFMVQEIRM